MDSDNIILALVIADLRDRAEFGRKKYGHTLDQSPDDMLQHAYEEALDLCMYLKTEIKRKQKEKEVNERLPLDVGYALCGQN